MKPHVRLLPPASSYNVRHLDVVYELSIRSPFLRERGAGIAKSNEHLKKRVFLESVIRQGESRQGDYVGEARATDLVLKIRQN